MTAIDETIEWIEKFVIRHNLCPFAKHPHENEIIYYATNRGSKMEDLLQEAFDQILQLDRRSPKECTTSFYIIDSEPVSFIQLLDMIDLLETLMENFKLSSQFQLVAFHPEFEFHGEGRDAISNKVNQSPFPMIHILRRSQVQHAMASQNTVDEITSRNDLTLRELPKFKSTSS